MLTIDLDSQLHCSSLHCNSLNCSTLHCTNLEHTALHCTTLSALHYITVHYTALNCTTAISIGLNIVLAASFLILRAMFQQFKTFFVKKKSFLNSNWLVFASVFGKTYLKWDANIINGVKLPLPKTQIWPLLCLVHYASTIVVTDKIFSRPGP